MAFCINCGTELPDGAKFCPGCGTVVGQVEPVKKEEPPKSAMLYIYRENTHQYVGAGSRIYVDGNLITTIYQTNGAKIRLSPGRHDIKITIDAYSASYSVDLREGGETYLLHRLIPSDLKQSITFAYMRPAEQIPFTEVDATQIDKPEKIGVAASVRKCSKCGGPVSFQTVTESGSMGVAAILGLAVLTILLFFVTPLIAIIVGVVGLVAIARGSNETVTYAVCQKCGNRDRQY